MGFGKDLILKEKEFWCDSKEVRRKYTQISMYLLIEFIMSQYEESSLNSSIQNSVYITDCPGLE